MTNDGSGNERFPFAPRDRSGLAVRHLDGLNGVAPVGARAQADVEPPQPPIRGIEINTVQTLAGAAAKLTPPVRLADLGDAVRVNP